MNGYTVGPYRKIMFDPPLEDFTGARFAIHADAAPGGVAVLIGGLGNAEEEANANLFVAAPELFAALEWAILWNAEYKQLNNLSGDPEWVRLAEAAIRKAEGKVAA